MRLESLSALGWHIYNPVSFSYFFQCLPKYYFKTIGYIYQVIWYQQQSHKYFKSKFVLSLKQNTRYELLKISLDLIPVPACYSYIVLKYTFTSAEKGDKSNRCSCKTFHILLQLPQEASDRTTDAAASTEKKYIEIYRNIYTEIACRRIY